ncbi:MAG: CHAT domain-containing protein [Oscillochloridaceae bacterium umkhey_bin13]
MMEFDDLVQLITDPNRSLDEVASRIASDLAPEQIDAELLGQLRIRFRHEEDEQTVLRAMLVGLRQAPLAAAAPLDLYSLWLTRKNLPQIAPDLLRVVAWGYAWAGDPFAEAKILANLADCLFNGDDFAAALLVIQRARRYFDQVQFRLGQQKCRLLEICIFNELQRPAESEASYLQLQQILDPQSTDLFEVENRFEALLLRGAFYQSLHDDLAAAAACYDEAATLLPQIEAKAQFPFRLALNQGLLALRLGQYAEARRAFERAEATLALRDEAADRYDLRLEQLALALLSADQTQARVYLQDLQRLDQQGEQSRKQRAERQLYEALIVAAQNRAHSATLLQKAIDDFKALQADLLVVVGLTYLAELHFQAAALPLARQVLDEAERALAHHRAPRRRLELQRLTAQYDPDLAVSERETVAQTLEEYGDQLGAAAVWQAIGAAYERTQQPVAARSAYERSLTLGHQARGLVRQRLFTLDPHQVRRRVAERAIALSPDPAQKLAVLERVRAQLLLDEIANVGLWRLLDHADLHEIRTAYQRLSYEQARLSLFEARVNAPTLAAEDATAAYAEPGERLQAYQTAERAYFAAIERIEAAKADRVGWLTVQPAELATMQAALPANGVLVNFMLIQVDHGHELHALVLHATGPIQHLLVARDDEWELFVNAWQADALIAGNQIQPVVQANQALQEIYNTFFAPLEAQLNGRDYLLIARDESLHPYPLHAAYDGLAYLIEHLAVSYVPSGSVLALLAKRRHQLARPTQRLLAGWDAVGDRRFAALPKIPAELDSLAKLTGGEACHGDHDPDALRAAMSQAQLIHLMCHGDFPEGQSPRFAQLVTGRHRLYADDLYRSELVADLLFLDACYSGQVGLGLQGLVSAALVAGVSSVIAAQWQVEYQRARPLVRAFYTHWRAGVSLSQALRRAQHDASKHNPPGAWAHFYLTGLPV